MRLLLILKALMRKKYCYCRNYKEKIDASFVKHEILFPNNRNNGSKSLEDVVPFIDSNQLLYAKVSVPVSIVLKPYSSINVLQTNAVENNAISFDLEPLAARAMHNIAVTVMPYKEVIKLNI